MATNNRGGTTGRSSSNKKSTTGTTRARSAGNRSTGTRSSGGRSEASKREIAGGYAGGFIEAVKARPLTTAAIAAGAAGASAFLWAKRAQLADQVGELRDSISERFASDDSASSTDYEDATTASPSSSSTKKARKASSTDPMMAEQSAVGAISY
ncbi:MAG: hypothetical protein M3N06_10160 [Pseudomonadota bacterium]|nr:hypothetical protein [Pseudomonadota bacterium]